MNKSKSYSGFSHDVFFYSSITFVPIGLALNIVQMLVFNSKYFDKTTKKSNIGFLMKIFVAADSLALFWNFLIYQSIIGYQYFQMYSQMTCSLFLYLSLVIQQIPLYFQAFITFNTYLGVVYPYKFNSFKQKKNLIFSFLCIICFLLVLNLPSSLRYLKIKSNGHTSCESINNQIHAITTVQTALFRCFLPYLIINTLNVLTLKKLVLSKSALKVSLVNERRFAFVIEILGFIYFLFNFPFCCMQIFHVIGEYLFKLSLNSNTMIQMKMWQELSSAFAWFYYGIGFFINFYFNKLFKKSFFKLISF